MHITLDDQQWESGTHITLGDVLAEVSERAHARARLVTCLQLDQRTITDRDLDPLFLAEPVSRFRQLAAQSQSMPAILEAAQSSVVKYGEELRAEGRALTAPLRFNADSLPTLDLWLGKLADYLELVEGKPGAATEPCPPGVLSWVKELLDARADRDRVRMADILEYEILPALESRP
jgi:hypothetical protein